MSTQTKKGLSAFIKGSKINRTLLRALPLILIIVGGGIYINYTWNRIQKEANENVLKIATSIEAVIPKEGLTNLSGNDSDLNDPYYQKLKSTLTEAIRVNKEARFAYIFKPVGNKIYFIADSEPVSSIDYSPPGQEFAEATETDWYPIKLGKSVVSDPLTDRWGTWISVMIPVKDHKTNNIVAVFGMDFNAASYGASIFKEVLYSGIIILLLVLAMIMHYRIRENNDKLKDEIEIRKQAEAIVSKQNKELIEVNLTKDKFFSIIAHDLRGPFAGFLGLTEMLAGTLHNMSLDQIQKFASSMEKTSRNLYRLLDNLLQWSLVQRDGITYNPKTIDLNELVDESIATALESARYKEIDFKIIIPDVLKVYADTQMLNAIIRNLVSNAVKYTPRGGTISLHAEIENECETKIAITDTGIGMSPEIADSLFSLTEKKNREGTEGEPSTGLGLLICKDFVEKNKGKIWVKSKEGEGTTFYLTIPSNKMSA